MSSQSEYFSSNAVFSHRRSHTCIRRLVDSVRRFLPALYCHFGVSSEGPELSTTEILAVFEEKNHRIEL